MTVAGKNLETIMILKKNLSTVTLASNNESIGLGKMKTKPELQKLIDQAFFETQQIKGVEHVESIETLLKSYLIDKAVDRTIQLFESLLGDLNLYELKMAYSLIAEKQQGQTQEREPDVESKPTRDKRSRVKRAH